MVPASRFTDAGRQGRAVLCTGTEVTRPVRDPGRSVLIS